MMKILLPAMMAATLYGVGSMAGAAADKTLEPIIVHGPDRTVDCTPPSAVPGCAALHEKIRATFTPREIQVLFGARTATAEGLTEYPHLWQRYEAFMQNVDVDALASGAKDARP